MARRLKAQYQIQVKRIQVDGGSELLGSEEGELWQELISDGVFVIISAPYYPEMNGIAERSNRVIIEMARCWMIAAKAPPFLWEYFWASAVDYSNFLVNNKAKEVTPYEGFFDVVRPGGDHKVDLSNCRTPGCIIYANIPKGRRINSHKMAPTAEKGLLQWKGRTTYVVYLPDRP